MEYLDALKEWAYGHTENPDVVSAVRQRMSEHGKTINEPIYRGISCASSYGVGDAVTMNGLSSWSYSWRVATMFANLDENPGLNRYVFVLKTASGLNIHPLSQFGSEYEIILDVPGIVIEEMENSSNSEFIVFHCRIA